MILFCILKFGDVYGENAILNVQKHGMWKCRTCEYIYLKKKLNEYQIKAAIKSKYKSDHINVFNYLSFGAKTERLREEELQILSILNRTGRKASKLRVRLRLLSQIKLEITRGNQLLWTQKLVNQ